MLLNLVHRHRVKRHKVKRPRVKRPRARRPWVKRPRVKRPRVKRHKVKQPRVKRPRVKRPRVKWPRVKRPRVKRPKVKWPRVKRPRVKWQRVKRQRIKRQTVKMKKNISFNYSFNTICRISLNFGLGQVNTISGPSAVVKIGLGAERCGLSNAKKCALTQNNGLRVCRTFWPYIVLTLVAFLTLCRLTQWHLTLCRWIRRYCNFCILK